jgi:hypothetical protein
VTPRVVATVARWALIVALVLQLIVLAALALTRWVPL